MCEAALQKENLRSYTPRRSWEPVYRACVCVCVCKSEGLGQNWNLGITTWEKREYCKPLFFWHGSGLQEWCEVTGIMIPGTLGPSNIISCSQDILLFSQLERQWERELTSASSHPSYLQALGLGWDQTQELGTQSRSLCGLQGPSCSSHFCCLCIDRKLEGRVRSLNKTNPRNSDVTNGLLDQCCWSLPARLATCPELWLLPVMATDTHMWVFTFIPTSPSTLGNI